MRTNTDLGIKTDWQVNDIVKPANMNALTKSIQYDYVVTEDMIYDKTGEVDVDELLGGNKINNVSGTVSVLINASSVSFPENLVLKFPATSSGVLYVHVYLRYSALIKVEGSSGGTTYYFHTGGSARGMAAQAVVARLKGVGMHTCVGSFLAASMITVPENGTLVYEARVLPGATVTAASGGSIEQKAWESNDMFDSHAHHVDADRVPAVVTPEDDPYGFNHSFGFSHKSNIYGGTINVTTGAENALIIGGEDANGRPYGNEWRYQPTIKIGLNVGTTFTDIHPIINITQWDLNAWMASGGKYCFFSYVSTVSKQFGNQTEATTSMRGDTLSFRDGSGHPSGIPQFIQLADGINLTNTTVAAYYKASIDIMVTRSGDTVPDSRFIMPFHFDIILNATDSGVRNGWWTGYHGEAGGTMLISTALDKPVQVLLWNGKGWDWANNKPMKP